MQCSVDWWGLNLLSGKQKYSNLNLTVDPIDEIDHLRLYSEAAALEYKSELYMDISTHG